MKFNHPIDNLPNSVKRIIFHRDTADYDFNQKINKLPKNIEEFHFFYIPNLCFRDKIHDKLEIINEIINKYNIRKILLNK